MSDELKERVKQFNTMRLPGQPLGMHMGTSYLVNDLAKRVTALEAQLAEARRREGLLRDLANEAHDYIKYEPVDLVPSEYFALRQAAIDGGALEGGE